MSTEYPETFQMTSLQADCRSVTSLFSLLQTVTGTSSVMLQGLFGVTDVKAPSGLRSADTQQGAPAVLF